MRPCCGLTRRNPILPQSTQPPASPSCRLNEPEAIGLKAYAPVGDRRGYIVITRHQDIIFSYSLSGTASRLIVFLSVLSELRGEIN